MKDNRKNRKLLFIRTKNRIRCGGSVFTSIKITDEVWQYTHVKSKIEDYSNKESIEKNYKLPFKLNVINVDTGYINDDFIRNTRTVKYELNRYKLS